MWKIPFSTGGSLIYLYIFFFKGENDIYKEFKIPCTYWRKMSLELIKSKTKRKENEMKITYGIEKFHGTNAKWGSISNNERS